MEIGSKGALARVEATAVRDGIGTLTRAEKKRTTGEEIEGVVLSEITELFRIQDNMPIELANRLIMAEVTKITTRKEAGRPKEEAVVLSSHILPVTELRRMT